MSNDTETNSWDTLYKKYPNLFVNLTNKYSPMVFGIECGFGWYEILSSLCWMINQHERNIQSRTEWKQKKDSNYESDYRLVTFDQIKEKFGGLRVYYSGGDDYIDGLVKMAEAISYNTCIVCGNKGEANKSGWISVLCDTHRNSIKNNQ